MGGVPKLQRKVRRVRPLPPQTSAPRARRFPNSRRVEAHQPGGRDDRRSASGGGLARVTKTGAAHDLRRRIGRAARSSSGQSRRRREKARAKRVRAPVRRGQFLAQDESSPRRVPSCGELEITMFEIAQIRRDRTRGETPRRATAPAARSSAAPEPRRRRAPATGDGERRGAESSTLIATAPKRPATRRATSRPAPIAQTARGDPKRRRAVPRAKATSSRRRNAQTKRRLPRATQRDQRARTIVAGPYASAAAASAVSDVAAQATEGRRTTLGSAANAG